MSKSTTPLKQVVAIISKAKVDINELLSAKEHHMLLIGLNANLDKMANRVNFLSGSSVSTTGQAHFPPVTNFMGEEITLPKAIEKDDLEPGEADRLTFIDKVERLYAEFLSIPIDGILNAYTIPEDQLVVRGVAKKAGIEGYADREFTVKFMEEIAEGIKSKEAEDVKQKEIDQQLKKLDSNPGNESEEDGDKESGPDEQSISAAKQIAEEAKQTKKAGKK